MSILQQCGNQEVGSQYWYASIFLTNKSVDSTPFWRVTSTSKKIAFSLVQFTVNVIDGWNELISLINNLRNLSMFSNKRYYSRAAIKSIHMVE